MRCLRTAAAATAVSSLFVALPGRAQDYNPCTTSRSALIIWYLQWDQAFPNGCKKTQAALDAVQTSFAYYESRGESWSGDETPFQLFNKAPDISLPFVELAWSGKGLIFVNTHGFQTQAGVNGYPVLEYHATQASATTAGINYINTQGYTDLWVVVPNPNVSYLNFSGLIVGGQDIVNKYRTNDGNGLVFAAWSNSWHARAAFNYAGGAYVGNSISPGCDASDANIQSAFNAFGCKPGTPGNYVSIATPTTMSSEGDGDWAYSCLISCDNGVAMFPAAGAFEDKVWGVIDHKESSAIRVLGFKSADEWPEHGVLLREIKPYEDGKNVYVADDVIGYPLYGWCEVDRGGHESFSEPFGVSDRPANWDALLAFKSDARQVAPVGAGSGPHSNVREVWVGENGRALFEKPKGNENTILSDPPPGADVALLATNANYNMLVTEKASLESINPSWTVRIFWADPMVSLWSQQLIANTVRSDNLAYNNWCAENPGQCTRTYPEEPVLGLIGEIIAPTKTVELGTVPDPLGKCFGTCYDFGGGANVVSGSSALEDMPVYIIPARTLTDVVRLTDSATRYEDASDPSNQTQRALFLVGDRYNGGIHADPDEALTEIANGLADGIPVYSLRASSYAVGQVSPRMTAFIGAVNAGASVIAGCGGPADVSSWPGDFTGNYPTFVNWSQLTRQQSLVVILPDCYTGRVGTTDPFQPVHQIRDGLFAPLSGTTIAFATGDLNGDYDIHHYLWAEVLGQTLGDAAVGTPWPRIVFDAKKRAATQYPFMLDYLRGTASFGTMVRKRAAPAVSDAGDDGLETARPLALRVLASGRPQPALEFSMPKADEVIMAIYDVRGGLVATIYDGRADAGRQQITWNGRDKQGHLVGSGVFFARLFTKSSGVASTKVVIVR